MLLSSVWRCDTFPSRSCADQHAASCFPRKGHPSRAPIWCESLIYPLHPARGSPRVARADATGGVFGGTKRDCISRYGILKRSHCCHEDAREEHWPRRQCWRYGSPSSILPAAQRLIYPRRALPGAADVHGVGISPLKMA